MKGITRSLRLLRDPRGFLGLLLCLYFAQGLFGLLQAAGLAGWALVASGLHQLAFLYGLSSFEQLADGLSTVTLFTLMMDACRRDSAGTDYTLQASLFVAVSGTARLGSGFLTEVAGYGPVFLLAGGLTVLALLPVLAYFRRRERS